jgi:hypothetical protein
MNEDTINGLFEQLKEKWFGITKEKLKRSRKEYLWFMTKYGENISLENGKIFFHFIGKDNGILLTKEKKLEDKILLRIRQMNRIMKEVEESIIDLDSIERIKILKMMLGKE